MDLKKIIAVTGRPGLYTLDAQTRGGVIATSLVDGKRIITTPSQQISLLSDIQIYCLGKEVPLTLVFEKMLVHEGGKIASVKPKASNSDLEAYFFDVLEDYDEERVYPSDIKKIIQWYNLLIANKLISLTPKESKKETKQTPTTKEK
ncbi:MAG: DUF5606 domain-containing protein [Flavobacteriaceae bacterium]